MLKPLVVGAVALVAASTAAPAAERSVRTEITLDNGITIVDAERSFDPATGAFARRGELTLKTGLKLTYSVDGTCATVWTNCDFSGTAEGPHGGDWTFSGTFVRDEDGSTLVADVTGPKGRHIKLKRTVTGDAPLLALDMIDN